MTDTRVGFFKSVEGCVLSAFVEAEDSALSGCSSREFTEACIYVYMYV
jgi:hypothetical protein